MKEPEEEKNRNQSKASAEDLPSSGRVSPGFHPCMRSCCLILSCWVVADGWEILKLAICFGTDFLLLFFLFLMRFLTSVYVSITIIPFLVSWFRERLVRTAKG